MASRALHILPPGSPRRRGGRHRPALHYGTWPQACVSERELSAARRRPPPLHAPVAALWQPIAETATIARAAGPGLQACSARRRRTNAVGRRPSAAPSAWRMWACIRRAPAGAAFGTQKARATDDPIVAERVCIEAAACVRRQQAATRGGGRWASGRRLRHTLYSVLHNSQKAS